MSLIDMTVERRRVRLKGGQDTYADFIVTLPSSSLPRDERERQLQTQVEQLLKSHGYGLTEGINSTSSSTSSSSGGVGDLSEKDRLALVQSKARKVARNILRDEDQRYDKGWMESANTRPAITDDADADHHLRSPPGRGSHSAMSRAAVDDQLGRGQSRGGGLSSFSSSSEREPLTTVRFVLGGKKLQVPVHRGDSTEDVLRRLEREFGRTLEGTVRSRTLLHVSIWHVIILGLSRHLHVLKCVSSFPPSHTHSVSVIHCRACSPCHFHPRPLLFLTA